MRPATNASKPRPVPKSPRLWGSPWVHPLRRVMSDIALSPKPTLARGIERGPLHNLLEIEAAYGPTSVVGEIRHGADMADAQ
jgi:hypothetical protein